MRDAGEVRLAATVTGEVQGVGYRYYTRRAANALALRGYVRNLSGGGVEVIAEGPRDALEQLLAVLRRGPPGSRVEDVAVTWGEAEGVFSGFVIRHRGE